VTTRGAGAAAATAGWVVTTAPVEAERPASAEAPATEQPWVTIVWNDPVNLMSYVTYVFQSYFGYPRARAEELMQDVHTKGRAVVSSGSLEEMERDVEALHGFGLWATFSHDS
jgi:ATP-dependent Clp protease adaptor protein ClpS